MKKMGAVVAVIFGASFTLRGAVLVVLLALKIPLATREQKLAYLLGELVGTLLVITIFALLGLKGWRYLNGLNGSKHPHA